MEKLKVPEPYSCGLILSYYCNCECKQCMYFGSPNWSADWISERDLKLTLEKLSKTIKHLPYGPDEVSLNHGLHFTGGEPFLRYDLLLKGVELANEYKIPSTFVETNCYWCKNDEITTKRFKELKEKGLNGVLISVNPFMLEYIPFEMTERAIRICNQLFERNLMVYQAGYYTQFKNFEFKDTLPLDNYKRLVSLEDLKRSVEILQMGRAPYKLTDWYNKYPASYFFAESCAPELVRNWHIHVDNYGNYMPGYCGGLSWGKIKDIDKLCNNGIDLEEKLILKTLIFFGLEDLYGLAASEFGYEELEGGYISKCHLCFDIRKELVKKTDRFKELNPREFYFHL